MKRPPPNYDGDGVWLQVLLAVGVIKGACLYARVPGLRSDRVKNRSRGLFGSDIKDSQAIWAHLIFELQLRKAFPYRTPTDPPPVRTSAPNLPVSCAAIWEQAQASLGYA
ncbi:hypothetical protein DPEC_G00309710 [Dallia pectoralis]|uniref:Uncharacterized protein n=1 Tax=Dallia pectoralis TaxID=75939 RepID=A0ACC2FF60_DALPE|nr:hypothetical protein DPEC_G00309710 [Dallia pectoralis]